MKNSTVIAIVLLLAALIAGGVFYFRDTDGPRLALTPASGPVSGKRPLTLELEDAGSGLKSVEVTAVQGEKSFPILTGSYGQGTLTHSEPLSLAEAALKSGPLEIRVTATDHSVYRFGAGNTTVQSFTFDYDRKAPVISVLSGAHNLNQGGAGLIVYTLSEEPERTGVEVGERFFPAYRQKGETWACLFPHPYDLPAAEFTPQVVAIDRAGNERRSGFYHHSNPRRFPAADIKISQRFLDAKMPQFEDLFPEAQDLLEVFLKVNGELRAQNRATLLDYAARTATQPLWQGTFMRQPGAANREPFGAARSYYSDGRKVDRQRHLGIDLASVAQAPVPSANRGRVVFADFLGIYGNCVIVDHGLGLQTLYAHLSSIAVESDQEVGKGDILGNSGATGMAGGDHLHYAVLVGGLPVNPIEWWDGAWIRNNISGKLAQAANPGQGID